MSERDAADDTPLFGPVADTKKVEVLATPIKSVADKKLYKTIRLENGLTALLISDPRKAPKDSSDPEKSEKSKGQDCNKQQLAACALSVGVGSFSDPPDIQGLAHFVEHMVFMGSEKYPKENEFDDFIRKNGGLINSEGDGEMTTFNFGIPESNLPQALEMFSQFFISPLMTKEAMQHQREALESEFATAVPSDGDRIAKLVYSLFPEGHPARTYALVDLRSLHTNDNERLFRAAHEFRSRHYSAHRMTVAVQARMKMSSLQQHVANTFSQIPSNALPPDDHSHFAYSADSVTPEFRSLYYVKPIKDVSEVHVTWCLRSLTSEYRSKPHQYISFMLAHKGTGSLHSYLEKKAWAQDVFAGYLESGTQYASMYSLFTTKIVVTEDGLEHLDEVLEAMFSYLNMLRNSGPNHRIFNELKKIENNRFRSEEEQQPDAYVKTLAENMHRYPPGHYITGGRLYYKYDHKGISDLMDSLRPDMANIIVLSNKPTKPIQNDAKEK